MRKTLSLIVFSLFFALGIQIVSGAYNSILEIVDQNSDVSDWIKYEKIVSAVEEDGEIKFTREFERSDKIGFVSFSSINKTAKITWYDTLYCGKIETSLNRKLRTQEWTDLISKQGGKEDRFIWTYEEERPRESENFCQLRGKLILTTPRGNQKAEIYESNIFKIK